MRFIRLLMVLTFSFLTTLVIAQPAEYEKIFELVKAPDELVVAEFTVAGRNSIFSVEIESLKKLGEIKKMFVSGAGLHLISAVLKPPTNWKLILTNVPSPEIPEEPLEKAMEIPWLNQNNTFSIFSIDEKKLTVTTFPTNPDELGKNLALAENYGMKFSGSEPGPESSSANFTLEFNSPKVTAPSTAAEVDELASELSKISNLLDSQTGPQAREYTMEAGFDQIARLIELPAQFNRSLKFISLNCLNQKQAKITLKVADHKNDLGKKIAILKNLVQETPIQWATDGLKSAAPVMTGFETDFGSKLTLLGISPKSSMIFSQFFSMVERSQGLKNPFFSRGTYEDTPDGKVMLFRVDCDW
ncbi:MAG: hypothetical protein ACOYXC_03665 [Candidatus Rifleibacteriota bacterium]